MPKPVLPAFDRAETDAMFDRLRGHSQWKIFAEESDPVATARMREFGMEQITDELAAIMREKGQEFKKMVRRGAGVTISGYRMYLKEMRDSYPLAFEDDPQSYFVTLENGYGYSIQIEVPVAKLQTL